MSTTRMPAILAHVAIALALVLPLATGCGDDGGAGPVIHTAPNGDEFSEADADFTSGMIQHHAEALALVDLTVGRDLIPEVVSVVEQIRATRSTEIELMTDWLVAWDRKIPETVRDHANSHAGAHAGDAAELESAPRGEFEQLWLEAMIEHQQEAIAMAKSEQDEGHNDAAVGLADEIVDTQSAEIATMESLLR